jgi:predicted ABC-type ATPase
MKYALIICGPSAVGKSTHIPEMLEHAGLPSSFSLIDPDSFGLESQRDRSNRAFEEVDEHISAGKSFVYVGSCLRKNKLETVFHKLRRSKFKTVACIVYTDTETAVRRAKERLNQPVPEDVVRDFHSQFKKRASELMENPLVDEVYLYNNEEQFSLLLSKKKKKIVCRTADADFFFDISKYC